MPKSKRQRKLPRGPETLKRLRQESDIAAGRKVINVGGIYEHVKKTVDKLLSAVPPEDVDRMAFMALAKQLVFCFTGMGALRSQYANDIPPVAEACATAAHEIWKEKKKAQSSLIILPS